MPLSLRCDLMSNVVNNGYLLLLSSVFGLSFSFFIFFSLLTTRQNINHFAFIICNSYLHLYIYFLLYIYIYIYYITFVLKTRYELVAL